jgi:DNA-binding MarR family transcriptional regulator
MAKVTDPTTDDIEILQAATRLLAGVALRSVDVLGSSVTLPQYRVLAVLADLGDVRSARVAQALGLEASTVTRLVDRLTAAGHVTRNADPHQPQRGDASSDRHWQATRGPGDRLAARRA